MKAAPAAEAENSGAFGIFGWIIVVAAALGIIALVMYFVIRKKEA
jgi:heme exporter protein D